MSGLKDPAFTHVSDRLKTFSDSINSRLSPRRLNQLKKDIEQEAAESLQPYGYYHAQVKSTLKKEGENAWRLDVDVTPGPPLVIVKSTVELTGLGANLKELQGWKKRWPLKAGSILDQTIWDALKQEALDLAAADGYFGAVFTQHSLEVDLELNEANASLILETGPQSVIGEVTYQQDVVKPGILELLPRFEQGQAYDAWLVEKFRLDVWRTGYFDEVNVIEEQHQDQNPPQVDLLLTAKARPRNTYQGTLGFGTDTEIRVQALWNRHLLSSRGDSMDMGVGWQQRNKEYVFRTNYRIPRRLKAREFWTANLGVRKENNDFEIKASDDDPNFIKLTNGTVTDYSLKLGKLIVRDQYQGYQQLSETWYGQYVLETRSFDLNNLTIDGADSFVLTEGLELLQANNQSFSLGVSWDLPVVQGNAFRTFGHHERARIFSSNKVWGSDATFSQAYISSTWHKLLGQSWKVKLRGEIGYSDANVTDVNLDLGSQELNLSVTQLPNLYRFKAGGSRSVRGYSFEGLSNNGIGSNNIITASAEIEWNILENWSVAAFFDIGNAFNDWSETRLKRGAGLGIRWYSIAGPIRLDIAQALDFEGHPWTLHFTIGTPLL